MPDRDELRQAAREALEWLEPTDYDRRRGMKARERLRAALAAEREPEPVFELERDRHGLIFSGPHIAVGECVRVRLLDDPESAAERVLPDERPEADGPCLLAPEGDHEAYVHPAPGRVRAADPRREHGDGRAHDRRSWIGGRPASAPDEFGVTDEQA